MRLFRLYRVLSPRADLTFDPARQRARRVPKAVGSSDDSFSLGGTTGRRTFPWFRRRVIYEAHVKGLTKPPRRRRAHPPSAGTLFSRARHPPGRGSEHLEGGSAVTSIELPADPRLPPGPGFPAGEGAHQTTGATTTPAPFFYPAPEPRYMMPRRRQQRPCVIAHTRRLHGGEVSMVILDVVYKPHLRGRRASARRCPGAASTTPATTGLLPDDPRHCINDTGTGNTMNLSNARVLQMVMDSLRYWATSYRVDGFRFDLGVTLGARAARLRSRRGLLRRPCARTRSSRARS